MSQDDPLPPTTYQAPYHELPELSITDLDALERDITALELLSSPGRFAEILSADDAEPWLPYEHLQLVDRALVELVEGRTTRKRLLITLPPRHGKSTLCSLYLPAWFLNKYPTKKIILASYGDDFAAEWGRHVRDLIDSNPELLGIKISKSSSAANRWDLDGHSGRMVTAGVGGQITGRGAHLLIIDDPVKNSEEAYSPTIREQKWRWWQTDVQSRLEPGAVVAVILTRWHEDDLGGRILLNEPDLWTHINLPALAEDDDPLGRTPGQALCPERYDANYLGALTASIGTAAFSSLYQQRPQPEGGGAFKRTDFRYWSAPPAEEKTYALHDTDGTLLVPQSECWRFITMDLALTRRTTSDYTVAAIWDVASWLEPSRLILVHVDRVRIEGAEHVDMVKRLWETWKPAFIGIEEAMQGSMTLDFARRQGVIVRPLKHKSRDKAFRAKDAELLVENHRVYFPKKASWLAEVEHELLLFPAGTHDDMVDCLVAGTLIETATGPRPIETINVGDQVWTRHGLRNVNVAWMSHPSTRVLTVTLSDGRTLTGTPRHPIWTEQLGFVPLARLTAGDTLHQWSKRSCSTGPHSAVTPTLPTTTIGGTGRLVRLIASTASTTYTAKSGKLLTVQYQPVGTSTTVTATRPTTTSQTWNVSHRKNIGNATPTTPEPRNSSPTSNGFVPSRVFGTKPPKVVRGIACTAARFGRTVKSLFATLVSGVVGQSRVVGISPRSSVLRNVVQPNDVLPVSTTNRESVPSAERRSASTGTRKLGPVPLSVVAVSEAGHAAVFNLSVDADPEYFANGVLVHNCTAYACKELLAGMNMTRRPKVPEPQTIEERVWASIANRNRPVNHPILGRMR